MIACCSAALRTFQCGITTESSDRSSPPLMLLDSSAFFAENQKITHIQSSVSTSRITSCRFSRFIFPNYSFHA